MSAPPAPSFDRRGALAKLHIAKAQLRLTDDSYRAILLRVAQVTSAAAASDRQLLALLAEMRRFGWKDKRPISDKPHVRKVWAVWGDLRDLVADHSDAALRTFVRRQTGLSDPNWLDARGANKVIEGLKAWGARLRAAGSAPSATEGADVAG